MQILGHILVIFSELASQKWSYFGHIFAKFGHILGHILGVNLVIFWKNLGGNPGHKNLFLVFSFKKGAVFFQLTSHCLAYFYSSAYIYMVWC